MGCVPSGKNSLFCKKSITKVDAVPCLKTKFSIGRENINRIYKFNGIIGKGYFSEVKLAERINDGFGKKYAIKVIKKRSIARRTDDFINELSILETIDHPNVIRLYETYEDENNFYLVMEYLSGGDLLQRIQSNKRNKEEFISKVLFKILCAINYCHSIGVVHRDIKPENILFSDDSEDAEVKLIDFGLGKRFSEDHNELMHSFTGTPFFIAPEVIEKNYTSKCDIWIIGATAYYLFTGFPPFPNNNKAEVLKAIRKHDPDFTSTCWRSFSPHALNLVKNLLTKSYKKRVTAEEALTHKFFSQTIENIHNPNLIDLSILNNLRLYQTPLRFKKLILNGLREFLSDQELKRINSTFHAININHDGFISRNELKQAFIQTDLEFEEDEINNIISRIDFDNNDKLNYSEFLIASSKLQNMLDNQRITKLFKKFDTEGKGFISVKSIMKAMLRGGREVENKNEAVNIIKEVCHDNGETVSYEEFSYIMTNS